MLQVAAPLPAPIWGAGLLALLLALAAPAPGETVRLTPSLDNTLYESTTGNLSNGLGGSLMAARTNQATGSRRRTVMKFDVAAALPSGAIVTSASLQLRLEPSTPGTVALELHNLQADWGEGTSAASFPGQGTAATPGDATWLHRFYPDTLWTNPGGDFDATIVASTTVGPGAFYSWGPTTLLTSTVQRWLDDAASNHGWIMKSSEQAAGTARRFDSREAGDPALRPRLIIDYRLPGQENWLLY